MEADQTNHTDQALLPDIWALTHSYATPEERPMWSAAAPFFPLAPLTPALRKTLCTSAALEGNLPLLQWAREQSCPWNMGTTAGAATSGNLTVLQWARE